MLALRRLDMERPEKRTEKCIGKCNRIDLLHGRIIHKFGINEEEHRHIDRLPRIQPLLLKAEALDLAEVGRDLSRRDAVRRHSNDVLVALVRGREKSQRSLAGQNAHFSLLRNEFPGQHVRDRAVEGDAQAAGGRHGLQARRRIVRCVDRGFDRLASPAGLLANLFFLETEGQLVDACLWASRVEACHFIHGH